MIPLLYFAFVGVAVLVALSNWRAGLLLLLFAGALQDPVRKLMPGAPGWMVLAFMPVLLAVMGNVFLSPQNPWPDLIRAYPRLRFAIQLFTATLVIALLVLLFKYGLGAWQVGAIGLIGYLFPLLAIALGFAYARTCADTLRFIRVYCALTALLLVGGLLEYWNLFPGWPAIGTEALETVWIRHVPGYIVHLTSGFYRSPDLLGWHAGLLVMFSLLMTLYSRHPGWRAVWLSLAIWGAVILLISGRNKMIFMPPIFVAVVGITYLYKGNVNRSLTAVVAGAVSLGLLLTLNHQLKLDREYIQYAELGANVASARLKSHGLGEIVETYRQSGFLGEGLGSASTGKRYGAAASIRTWQESGTSKLMVELGILGFVASIALVVALARALLKGISRMPRRSADGTLFIGLLGILAANAASFIVSHQAFGDPFLVTLAGFFVGVALSAPRWAFGERRAE